VFAQVVDHRGRPVGQDGARVPGDEGLGGRIAVVMEAPGGFPQVLEYVDELADDMDRRLAHGGFGLDLLDLRPGAVDQDDPGATVFRVALFGLTDPVNHLPAALGPGSRCLSASPGGVITSAALRTAGSAS
jgi:hypothetical protein